MHYIWQHRLWPGQKLATVDGREVVVLDPGQLNTDAGPDFFNAKVIIDGKLWAGNVEMHIRASDWQRHGHQNNRAYDSVVLHVVWHDDAPVHRTNGELIPQLVLQPTERFANVLQSMTASTLEIPCQSRISEVSDLLRAETIQRMAYERLADKVKRVEQLLTNSRGNWEEACYITLARTLGFGINSDAFERLARSTPLITLFKHSDSRIQLEALLFGQAGLIPATATDRYTETLQREYAFLQHKYQLTPLPAEAWRLFRIRPQNFPLRRISMLAHYVEQGFGMISRLTQAETLDELYHALTPQLSHYWCEHFTFGHQLEQATATQLSHTSLDLMVINTAVPLLYAYGALNARPELCQRAVTMLEAIRPENNKITRTFAQAGIECTDALTSQALIHLKRNYCEPRKCIFCKIGHHLLSKEAFHRPRL